MSLIKQNNTKLAHDIISMIEPLAIVHITVNADNDSYSLGFKHESGFVYFNYVWGLVSLTIVEMWPLEIQHVYKMEALSEVQRSVLKPWLRKKFR